MPSFFRCTVWNRRLPLTLLTFQSQLTETSQWCCCCVVSYSIWDAKTIPPRTKSVLDAACSVFIVASFSHGNMRKLLVAIAGRDFSSLIQVVIKASCKKQKELHIRHPLYISYTVESPAKSPSQLGRPLKNINLSILLRRASYKREETMTPIPPQRKLKLEPWCKKEILWI